MSQTTIPIKQATASLAQLAMRAAGGEDILIGGNGEPHVRLTATDTRGAGIRLGLLEGKYAIPNDFDAPLPPEILAAFGCNDEVSS